MGDAERRQADMKELTKLFKDPIIIRVVTVLDITRLSILELLEYGLTRQEVSYAMTKGVIEIDKEAAPKAEITSAERILVEGDIYFTKFLSSKVRLTTLGLYLLDCIKGCQTEQQVIERAQGMFELGLFSPPDHPHGPR